MAVEVNLSAAGPIARTFCGPPMRLRPQTEARNRHYADRIKRSRAVLNITAGIAAVVCTSFTVMQLVTEPELWRIAVINLISAAVFFSIPLLHKYGELLAPLVLIISSYVSLTLMT